MNRYEYILDKLHRFIRKYYINELIKGFILFLSFGLLYFIFTVLVEYYLWLNPTYRTVLFWAFIIVELAFFVRYITLPLVKLFGFSKGITLEEASVIIGTHFPKIDDKLLNILQLQRDNPNSELALASIEQKSNNLQPIPFGNAILFSSNKKYIKYLFIPLLIYLFYLASGRINRINDSYTRIVQHQMAFQPPAPFEFQVHESDLKVIEGNPLQIHITTSGDIVPDDAKIIFNNEDYFLKKNGVGEFSYSFESLNKSLVFYLESAKVRSKNFTIKVVPTPKITQIQLLLSYPKYVHKKDETINNTGNFIVPEGTFVQWNIHTDQTTAISLVTHTDSLSFVSKNDIFTFSKTIINSLSYTLVSSNTYLTSYEKLSFTIDVLKDALPEMTIKTDIDSITTGPAQFFGTLSDDYGLTKLELIYYDIHKKNTIHSYDIPIKKSKLTTFYYVFPTNLDLVSGIDYEFYFKLYDNDRINGFKSINSQLFQYHKNTLLEQQDKLLLEQKEQLKLISNNLTKQQYNQNKLNSLAEDLKNKTKPEFNDTSKLQQYLNRQHEYREMMQRQTDQLQLNLKNQPKFSNPSLEEHRNDLLKRINETKDLLKDKKLLDELQKLADKLDKENLLDKIQKLSSNSKDKQKSLEQLLELTKRFYVEQKAEQIKETLNELAKKQDSLSVSDQNTKEKQDTLNKEFDFLKKAMDDLQNANDSLQEPMSFELPKPDQNSISQDMQQASEQLSKQQNSAASMKQKSASKKMQKMANSLQAQMAASDTIEEDITLLRIILENLLNFSFQQESLMNTMSTQSYDSPDYVSNLKEQYKLKDYFEYIDDSLYVLSMRQPKLSSRINTYLEAAHYYLDASLSHYPDNQYNKAISDQRFVMKSANDLALLLSILLDNMQSKLGMGKGKGKGKGQSFSLPDIIHQQEGLAKGMSKQGKQAGQKEGKGSETTRGSKGHSQSQHGKGTKQGGTNTFSDEEVLRIYQKQVQLRNALENQLNDNNSNKFNQMVSKVIKEMEELEQLLLQSGISRDDIAKRMLRLKSHLLQLKDAKEKQDFQPKREATSNTDSFNQLSPQQLIFKQLYFNRKEILNRQPLPLRSFYQKKAKQYFNEL